MQMISITDERKAQLEEYAHRHGQEAEIALDAVLADALEWERLDYQQAVEGIRQGYADLQAGRVRPVAEAFEELRKKHDLPR
jgi:predicted transcriptional regulator